MPTFSDAFDIPLLTNATLINSVSDPVPLGNTESFRAWATIKAGTTAGVLVTEWAPTRDFAGTWEQIDSLDIAARIAADAAFNTALAAGDVVVQMPLTWLGGGGFVRQRVPTAITGGATHTVTSAMRRVQIGYN